MSNPPFTVRAVFEYNSGHDDDLSFPIGQVVTVTAVEDAEWYCGEYTDGAGAKQEGIFPKNFVERYEPPAPPRPARPNRAKKEPEPAPVEPPVSVSESQPPAEPASAESPAADDNDTAAQQITSPLSPALASGPLAEAPSSPPQPAQAPVPSQAPAPEPAAAAPPPVKASSKPPPPAVADKPTGNSFKDRIAAFNKSAAAPVAPFKPGGQQSSSFIKKQFVAPPPSKDSFVAPPREFAPAVYKREEDPEVQEQIARDSSASEIRPPPAPPAPPAPEAEEGAEDQPKPTRLKDRIALLQKQQIEQAQRHAEAAQKKEKPKPPKKPVEQPAEPDAVEEDSESLVEPPATARDPSVDTLRAKAPPAQPTPFSPPEEVASESNDADHSATADSEDAGETSTSKEEEDEPPSQPSTRAAEHSEEAGEEETEEEDMDPETKRRMELRNRMAKMSGGMGMMGLFGPPGGLPGMGPTGGRKPKAPGESEPTSPVATPQVPMIPLPGMNVDKKPVVPTNVEKEDEGDVSTPITEQHSSREVPDVEEVVHEGAPPRRSTDRPPVPSAQGEKPQHALLYGQLTFLDTAPAPPPPASRPVPPPPAPVEQPASPPVPRGISPPHSTRIT